jgi:hypothetical protein
MGYTKEQVEEIAAKLRNMPKIEPPPRDLTKKEAVQKLAREIKSLKAKGYSLEQIVSSLKGFGLEVSTPTLRSYLQDSKARIKKGHKGADVLKQDSTSDGAEDSFMVASPQSSETKIENPDEKTKVKTSESKAKFTPKADRLGV